MQRLARPLFFAGGVVAAGLGALGAVLPLMPTVPFLLVAVFCFARSSPALEQRILNHHYFGPQVRDWHERRAISRKTKLIAIGAMAAGIGFTWHTLGYPYYLGSIAILVFVGGWIWTRNE